MNYGFHEAAEVELIQAVEHYNACRPNLGWEFAREVQAAIQSVLAHPTAWTLLSKRTRRCLVRRFPYGVIYQVAENGIRIIVFMQLNRKPGYWQGRIAEP